MLCSFSIVSLASSKLLTLTSFYSFSWFHRLIHVTEAVCEEIKNDFAIEDGEGYKRDVYLKEHNIKSFFIVPDAKKQQEREVII